MKEMLVKKSTDSGCVFLGKGIKNHPEMGVVCAAREVTFDEYDVMFQHWTGHEITRILYKTDTGYCFDNTQLGDVFEIELYAPNWRARKPDAWN